MRLIRYAETAPGGQQTGREVIVQGRELVPMAFADLAQRTLGRASPLTLRLADAEVVESSIEGIPKGQSATWDTTVSTDLTVRHVGLVRGGWLPAGLALEAGSVIMIDRCTLTDLKGRFKPNGRGKVGRDFVDWLDDPGVKVNPVLLALEGNQREFPSRVEIQAQMEEHVAHLRQLLPKAIVIGDAPDMVEAVIAFAEQHQTASERTIQFLLAIAPLLRHQVSRDRLPWVLREIVSTALRCGLAVTDMAVICAVSAAAVNKGRNSAKRALKLTEPSYGRRDAFNAMADLRSLKHFASLLGLVPNEHPMLCTSDKDLALVWTGLNISQFEFGDGQPTVKAHPVEEFLPRDAGLIFQQLLANMPR
ncbi:hypothetical protein [Roseateles asaccharophilus]|uniref:Uncharacterized protein n=1 Tax=Roseateles asaccharophilus TaxID=582607 RepID=A0ABU2AGA0_9BURK|nr:hypothetical protein [Roseateles asaccharophilus]MDR7336256.1 hypothetical protein [Roseateles asaccharophilus]